MMETGLDVVKTMNRLIVVLEHSRQAVVATQGGLLLGGALGAQSLDFQGENPRYDFHWLYLAMRSLSILRKTFPKIQSDFFWGENP